MGPLLRVATSTAAGAATVAAASLAYAALVERNLFTLRHFAVPVLPPDAAPLRLLHLSDAHLTPGQHTKQRWIASLADTHPDLVILTGDNIAAVDAVPVALRAYQPLLEYPGAFVFGSNDYRGPVLKNPFSYLFRSRRAHASDSPEVRSARGAPLPTGELRDALTGAGWLDLNNARRTLRVGDRTIDLIGVDDPHAGRDNYAAAQASSPATPGAELRIGLTHAPEPRVIDQMASDGYQLILAGHTHGGQVCVPGFGALITNCGLDRRMAKGLHRWQGLAPASRAEPHESAVLAHHRPEPTTFLHVSAGVGTHPTAPVRFACRPEASLVTLVERPSDEDRPARPTPTCP